MFRLVTIDLTRANLADFESYETEVLALLPRHDARLEFRLRALDGASETHLLYFPDEAAFEQFRADPDRVALAPIWERSGARSSIKPVERITD